MIATLRGKVLFKELNEAVIEVGGVGYEVHYSVTTHTHLPSEGEEVFLYVYTHVREDVIQLFGFFSIEERDLFRMLIQVSGIGPRSALNILSHNSPQELAEAIVSENIKKLVSIPGIGKRTAERLIVELRDKIKEKRLLNLQKEGEDSSALLQDLRSALIHLDYRPSQVDKVLAQLKPEVTPQSRLDELLKRALNKLRKV